MKSRDNQQLLGRDYSNGLSSNCEPLTMIEDTIGDVSTKKYIAPCGLIADSIFNGVLNFFDLVIFSDFHKLPLLCFADSFKLYYRGEDNSTNIEIGLLGKDISWTMDKLVKFGIPSNESKYCILVIAI